MESHPSWTGAERAGLWLLAVVGAVGLNGAFVYGLLARPGALGEAMANPIAAAFILESLLLVVVLAWLLARLRLSRKPWGWFVVFSLRGGIAFALPVMLMWGRDRDA